MTDFYDPDQIEQEGDEAYWSGNLICPYAASDPRYEYWQEGYLGARENDLSDDSDCEGCDDE